MNGKCLKSLYRDFNQFYLKILDYQVTTPTGFADNVKVPCFKVQCYEGQGFDTCIIWLREELIGSLYEIVDIPKKYQIKQYSIFDFI